MCLEYENLYLFHVYNTSFLISVLKYAVNSHPDSRALIKVFSSQMLLNQFL